MDTGSIDHFTHSYDLKAFINIVEARFITSLNFDVCVVHVLGVKKNFCYFSSLITFYYIHEW